MIIKYLEIILKNSSFEDLDILKVIKNQSVSNSNYIIDLLRLLNSLGSFERP